MQIHELPRDARKKKKRIGRGGKRGTYSGSGQKGQRARSGHRIRPAERDIISKLPKLRGIKHPPLSPKPIIFNVGDLERKFPEGIISYDILRAMRVVRSARDRVKILGKGVITKKMTICNVSVSQEAKKKIEEAGGTIQ